MSPSAVMSFAVPRKLIQNLVLAEQMFFMVHVRSFCIILLWLNLKACTALGQYYSQLEYVFEEKTQTALT